MKKENQQEAAQTMQKESRNEMHYATRWAADVSEIVSDTLKRQVDLSFERMHAMTRANLNLWASLMSSFNRPLRNSGQKNSFGPNFEPEQDGREREQEERPEKEQSKEFHRR